MSDSRTVAVVLAVIFALIILIVVILLICMADDHKIWNKVAALVVGKRLAEKEKAARQDTGKC